MCFVPAGLSDMSLFCLQQAAVKVEEQGADVAAQPAGDVQMNTEEKATTDAPDTDMTEANGTTSIKVGE